MIKAPNEDKNTTFLRQCLTSPSVKADLSALYSPNDLFVEQVEFEDMRTYHVYAQCSLPYGVCPYCGCVSHRVHSRYHRTITDLSIQGYPVIITFGARKFFCHNPYCRRKTFAEQPGDEVTLVEKMMSFGWFRDIYDAAASFYATIMGDDVNDLDTWLEKYGKSPIQELRSFAYGIRMDLKAVRNAIALDTSNGIVEGFVNKLKAVKRVMYGRASLDLLKRKMVFNDLCFN